VATAQNHKARDIVRQKEITQLNEAIQAAETAIRLSPGNNHFRHTLASVCGLAGRWAEAFEQAVFFADDSGLIEIGLGKTLPSCKTVSCYCAVFYGKQIRRYFGRKGFLVKPVHGLAAH
jgi:protein involved in temperature-dependent protein secretion